MRNRNSKVRTAPRYSRSQLLAMVKVEKPSNVISVNKVSAKHAQDIASAALLELYTLYFNNKVLHDRLVKLLTMLRAENAEKEEFAGYIEELYSQLEQQQGITNDKENQEEDIQHTP